MTLRKPDSQWWHYQPRRVPGQLRLRRAMEARPKSTKEQAEEILSRPGVVTPFGLRNISLDEARVVAQARAEAELAAGPKPQFGVVSPGELAENITFATPSTLVEAGQRAIPGRQQLERLTKEVGPVEAWRRMQWPTLKTPLVAEAAGVVAEAVTPGAGLFKGRLGKAVEEVAPKQFGPKGAAEMFLQPDVLLPLAKPAVSVTRAGARAAARAGAKGLVRVPVRPVQEAGLRLAGARGVAGGAIPLDPHEVGARIKRFLDPQLEARFRATNKAVEDTTYKMDAIAGTRPDEYFVALARSKGLKYPDPEKMSRGLWEFTSNRIGSDARLFFKSFDDVDQFLKTGEYKAPSITSPLRSGPIKPLYETTPARVSGGGPDTQALAATREERFFERAKRLYDEAPEEQQRAILQVASVDEHVPQFDRLKDPERMRVRNALEGSQGAQIQAATVRAQEKARIQGLRDSLKAAQDDVADQTRFVEEVERGRPFELWFYLPEGSFRKVPRRAGQPLRGPTVAATKRLQAAFDEAGMKLPEGISDRVWAEGSDQQITTLGDALRRQGFEPRVGPNNAGLFQREILATKTVRLRGLEEQLKQVEPTLTEAPPAVARPSEPVKPSTGAGVAGTPAAPPTKPVAPVAETIDAAAGQKVGSRRVDVLLQQQLKKATARVQRLENELQRTSPPERPLVDYPPGSPAKWAALRKAQAEERRIMEEMGLLQPRQTEPAGGRATPPTGMATLSDAQILRGFREATKKSAEFGEKRAALPPGTSRARVTTANARWATYAESRDRYAQEWMRRYPDRPIEEPAGGVVRKEAVEDIAAAPSPTARAAEEAPPAPGRTPRARRTPPPQVGAPGAAPEAAGVVPSSPAAGPKPRVSQLRLSIRATERQGGGFLISGRDTKGRQVRVWAKTLQEAKQARENIRQGVEAFPGTETEAAARALTRAERRYRAALKRGEAGAIQRAKTELEQLQGAGAVPPGAERPPAPPSLPPKIPPDGGAAPMPSFESARGKLVSLIRGAARRGQKDIEALRAKERSRRFAQSRGATEAALARGESPLPGIRTAQRGEMPTAELALSERLTGDEVAVLRDSIYKTLGPELDWTSANIEEALVRLGTEGKIPTDSELQWMEEIFGPELIEALRARRTGGQKAVELLLEAWNLPRALLASFDDSMVLRQGLHLLPEGAPAARAFKSHIRALTKAGSANINAEIRANPWFNQARAHGLDMSLPSLTRGLAGREEVFMGARLAQRIPIVGKGVEISERIATAYLNKLRIETYAAHAAELKRMDAGFDAFKDLATNINILSGRASLGRAQPIAPFLNGMFFSARLNWAAAQRPFRILKYAPDLNTEEGRHLAKMLARDVYGVWAGIGGMVGLAAAAGVAAVELDPRSSDFGKMQIGTVRVDPWAGQQQWATMMARLVTGERQTTTTRQDVPAEAMDTLSRFIESKFHPALGMLLTVQRGETYVGEKLTVQEFAKQWLPLFIQDIQEIAAGTSPGVAATLGVPAFFGVSVYNIPGVPATVLNQFRAAVDAYNAIPTDTLELKPEQSNRTQYRRLNPVADAALFLAGQVASLESDDAAQEVARLVQEHGLNPDNIRGIAERKERLQEAMEVGRALEPNEVDMLIKLLERGPQPAPQRPAPGRLRRGRLGGTNRLRRGRLVTPTPEPVGAR